MIKNYYTLLMDEYKNLKVTSKINLRQKEQFIDKIRIIAPQKYNDFDLGEFSFFMIYEDPSKIAHTIKLIRSDNYDENHIQFILDVDNNLNLYAGDISVYLKFIKNDYENGRIYSGQTSSSIITILNAADYYGIIDTKSLDFVTKAMAELQAQIDLLTTTSQIYSDSKLDDIVIDENGVLHGKANGKLIGDGVNVALPSTMDDKDGSADGVINIDKLYESIEI